MTTIIVLTTNESGANSLQNVNDNFSSINTYKLERQPLAVAAADATSITPTCDTADINTQINTQVGGTLTINAPTGTPGNNQKIMIRVKTTNAQTFAFNAIYRGSNDVPLPTTTTGTSKTDYLQFAYNSTDTKWDLLGKNFGF